MRLHRLTVTAFGPFATAQHIDFDALGEAGLFLLHGPTGAGKTSVLDAVCFALYGAVPGARQSPGTTLRSDHAPAGTPTEVVLDLTVAGRRLEITRRPAQQRPKRGGRSGYTTERASSGLREYDPVTGAWQALSRSHQEIGDEITELLGMSREQFCQVVLLPQGDFARFLRADAEARGKLLGRLFDTRRFAAVEERLAELRRASEQRVKSGDERLLALAHRMGQEAAGAAGEWPAPAARPGEPGLAAEVLAWAAVARSGARERLAAAGCALDAAGSRRAAAARLLEDARELAARQRRYADAELRRAELAGRRGEYEEWRAALDRARRADRVAGPLALRDDAEARHRAAVAGHDRARAALEPELAGAGPEQLDDRARRARRELAELDAARGAERRRDELARERADSDREAGADEETRQEAAGWLDGWASRRRELQERIDTALEAGTRAERLAGRIEPARRRLAAARRRDELAGRVTAAERELSATRERANTAHESWLDLRERRLRGIAAELAGRLADGEPCAVCGSPDHPAPARAGDGHVDRAAEETAYAEHTRADTARGEAERALAVVREALTAARAEAVDAPGDPQPPVAALAELVAGLADEHAGAHALAAGTHAAREALDRAEREHTERLAVRQEAERRIAARTSRREALDEQIAALEAELARIRGGGTGTVAEHAARLEARIERLTGATEAARAVEDTARRLKEAEGALSQAAFRAGFDTSDEAAAALLGDDARRELQHRLDARAAEEAAVADRLAEPETRAAAGRPPADPAAAEAAHTAAEEALRAAHTALAAHRDRCAELDRLSREAAREARGLGPLRAEYDRVAGLAGLTAGTSAANERKMRLESYVLAARLEQVAAAATARLSRMSGGRYTLVHSDARSGTRRSGLGLHVVDAWTGRERDTATLSGGETFFASLALALGLADVVTEEAGGVRLDTLFIDEGFGSLDDQTLDEVLDVLDSLRERDRCVGIVSHVADLRRRVPAQLEVVKERGGSAVRLRTYAG
ncbi:SMC family ATPase [Streptomyces sp. LP05-1]|uniref:Nuclease SbcCD subunit C n=1 Tax=Streptomyces pyxinae TaxID=2970734 RepID=A0ABT2CE19_9ACTN|nr:SMC family ATPase [Streptomyces sp. LP05-1]MCS0635645.1 SMC family ATPase [Streptomyces sp. LP05-1]